MIPAADYPQSSLEYALAYAAQGLRVLPIVPGAKRPPMTSWQNHATHNPQVLNNWFTQLYASHGVGLALGYTNQDRWVFALDVDEHDPNRSGGETLRALIEEHGPLPDTWVAITGSGGQHLLFISPTEVRNTVAGPGLDVRGEGGQIVVAPSVHPDTGRRYEWESGYAPWERDIADAPSWLLDLVLPPVQPAKPAPSGQATDAGSDDSPADFLRSRWDWESNLTAAGWVLGSNKPNGDTHWTRPGKDPRLGASAVLHVGGPLVVWSTDGSMAELRRLGTPTRDGSVAVSPLEYLAAYKYKGDLSAAARDVRRGMKAPDLVLKPSSLLPSVGSGSSTGYSSAPDPFSVQGNATETQTEGSPYDLRSHLIDWGDFWTKEHAGEAWLAWPLLPEGRQVALYAPAKSGKSLLTLAVVAAMATGRPILGRANHRGPIDVLYLDYEMVESDLFERLEALGYGPDDDLSHLHYALLPSLPPLNTPQGAAVLRELARVCDAQAVIVDTMGRAIEGEENSADSYRDFARLAGLGLKADGRAVLRTDHAGKDKDKGQRGSSAKNDDVDVVMRIDPLQDGWKLTTTHKRIGWAPDRVDLLKRTDDQERISIGVAPNSEPTYPEGTRELVATMRALGIDHDWSRRRAIGVLREAGTRKREALVGAALAWMKAELPTFNTKPTRAPEEAGTTSGTTTSGQGSGTTSGTTPSVEPLSYPLTGDGNGAGHHSGTTGTIGSSDSGHQCPPLGGHRAHAGPDEPPALDFDDPF